MKSARKTARVLAFLADYPRTYVLSCIDSTIDSEWDKRTAKQIATGIVEYTRRHEPAMSFYEPVQLRPTDGNMTLEQRYEEACDEPEYHIRYYLSGV